MMNFESKPIVLFGLNGAGKTNVLEAISMFAPGRGFRRVKFSELSRRPDSIGWKLTGNFQTQDRSFEIINHWDEVSGRKILIDGKSSNQSELGRLVRILWLTPAMDRIWLNGSIDRRRFLDRIVSNIVPEHTDNMINYHRALKQRNKLIKEQVSNAEWFDAVEKYMSISGFEINNARYYVIKKIMAMQKKSVSSFPIADLSIIGGKFSSAEEFKVALAQNRKQDLYAGRTLLGPHLTDLGAIYSSKGVSAKNCSTGEQKALLISVIIATAKIQLELFQTPPILLFDEVSAHLDEERRSLLYDELSKLNLQFFLTGTESNIFKDLETRAQYHQITLTSNQSLCTPL